MIPVLAIVGRPNVGKSTLFNQLTKTREALVADMPGMTRDRQYGQGRFNEQPFIVIDTGGIGEEDSEICQLVSEQVSCAIQEADAVLFLVDAKAGLTPGDRNIAQQLRVSNKPIYFVLNKVDGVNYDIVSAEFHELGFGQPLPIAATHRLGVTKLLEQVAEIFPKEQSSEEGRRLGIQVAIIGRPNVGKSTLVNRILGEERVMVFDKPGTTRDSIFIPFERQGQQYTIIDTAGVRKRGKVFEAVEKFSVVQTLQAIEACHVVVFVVDAREGFSNQDLRLLGHVLNSGKALVIAINKWDGMTTDDKMQVKNTLKRRLVFLDYAKQHFISALHGTGVGNLFGSIHKAYESAVKKLATPELTRLLQQAIDEFQPPMSKGRHIKLRYAHAGGHNPPKIIIHGTQVDKLPGSYSRYLEKFYRKRLKLVGTPVFIELCSSKNPYVDK